MQTASRNNAKNTAQLKIPCSFSRKAAFIVDLKGLLLVETLYDNVLLSSKGLESGVLAWNIQTVQILSFERDLAINGRLPDEPRYVSLYAL